MREIRLRLIKKNEKDDNEYENSMEFARFGPLVDLVELLLNSIHSEYRNHCLVGGTVGEKRAEIFIDIISKGLKECCTIDEKLFSKNIERLLEEADKKLSIEDLVNGKNE